MIYHSSKILDTLKKYLLASNHCLNLTAEYCGFSSLGTQIKFIGYSKPVLRKPAAS